MNQPPVTVVHLMRHGEVHNPEGVLYGRLPGYQLSALGRSMAETVARFLAGHDGWQRWFFVAIALGASAFIMHLLLRHAHQRMFSIALGLILGGAIGNVIDRLIHGQVTDFLLFHQGGWYFPAFNVADSAITVGAVLLILDELLRMKRVRVTT